MTNYSLGILNAHKIRHVGETVNLELPLKIKILETSCAFIIIIIILHFVSTISHFLVCRGTASFR